MCGIAGIVSRPDAAPPTPEVVRAMCGTIVHRGPDDEGVDVLGQVGLGMRRLSIIDLSGGRQPLHNEDRSVRLVFNGEIYNFRELRSELEAKGHRFASATDGEVAVHLWEECGADFARRLNGMFAIALHDVRNGRFVLVRDRVGIKPLFWASAPQGFVFGSEIKAILASGLVPRELDVDALGQFLAWEYVPAPATLFATIRKLDAGGMLEIDLKTGSVHISSWWDVPPRDGDGGAAFRSPQEWEEAVDQTIRTCVQRQLVSDVPLGAFLSGGVDSSLVVAGMGEARTFSIGFDDPSYNELEWSRAVADHLGVSHRTEVIRPRVVDLFQDLMGYMEDPIGDFSIFPTYLVSRLAREEVTVVLSGDGGDELFGGYETFQAQSLMRAWNLLPHALRHSVVAPAVRRVHPRPAKKGFVNKVKRFVEGWEHDDSLRHARWRLFLGSAARRELFTEDALARMSTPAEAHVQRLFERAGDRPQTDRCLYVDLKSYLVDNCLVKVDRMSMACSLEARVPLLDHELVELAFRVPPKLKVSPRATKILLKRVATRHVPAWCVYRPKQGFSIPVKNWLLTEFRPLLDELLAPKRLAAEGILRVPAVERLKREHLEGRANHSHVLWSLMVFQDWRRRWSA